MENQQRGGSRQDPGKAGRAENNEENFPGYPHYSPEEDITATGERVSANLEGVSRANNQTGASISGAAETPGGGGGTDRPKWDAGHPAPNAAQSPRSAVDAESEPDPDTDVTKEELMMLDRADRGVDESDDAQAPLRAQLDETDEDGDPLNEAAGREGMLGDDIDVPGSETDDANENIGEEDEENNYYSLGGDEKSGLDDANEGSINRI